MGFDARSKYTVRSEEKTAFSTILYTTRKEARLQAVRVAGKGYFLYGGTGKPVPYGSVR